MTHIAAVTADVRTNGHDVDRTRTFSWEDPMTGAQAAMTMAGIDYLRAMQAGTCRHRRCCTR